MLCSQMFGVENPHCLKAGALNEMHDEDEGGLVHANRLPTKYNALNFTAPSIDRVQKPSLQQDTSSNVFSNSNASFSFKSVQQTSH